MADVAPPSMESIVEAKLKAAFSPTYLTVEDQSDGCGSKISTIVVSEAFEGVALLARQRAVNDALAAEMPSIHALSMKTWTVCVLYPAPSSGMGTWNGAAPA